MAYELREGQGSLFTNEKQNDRQPDFKGSIMIKGVLYNISAWNRTSQNGRQYISLQAEERQSDGQQSYRQSQPRQQSGSQQYSQPAPARQTPPPPTEDDMPFDIGSSEDLPL